MAVDQARAWTDRQLSRMEKRVLTIYRGARKDLADKWIKYMRNADKRLQKLQDAYNAAVLSGDKDKIKETGDKLINAKQNITFRNKYYRDIVADMTYRLAKVNQVAIDYLNDQLPEIYRVNYNQAAKSAHDVGMAFKIVNEDTVKNLVKDGKIRLPKKRLDIPKDQLWNTRYFNSSVLQGILQGESMGDIAKRLFPEIMAKTDFTGKTPEEVAALIKRNEQAAIRNARTMVTGAENKGRLDSYKRLEEDGAVMKKVWIATPDGRTRESHLAIDGEEVGVNEEFSNGCMYPGDPACDDPAEVYNCRCTMITHITGFRKADGRVVHIDYDPEPTMHDRQMEEEKDRRGNG